MQWTWWYRWIGCPNTEVPEIGVIVLLPFLIILELENIICEICLKENEFT